MQERAFVELAALGEECGAPGWDGYGADAVNAGAIANARRFIEALPTRTPTPQIGADPDGAVTMEWHKAKNRTVSISIGLDNVLHYAAVVGSMRRFGTEMFDGKVPATILGLIQETLS